MNNRATEAKILKITVKTGHYQQIRIHSTYVLAYKCIKTHLLDDGNFF